LTFCDSLYFFFSSRRRHTRFSRDWSSDVCSSDLNTIEAVEAQTTVEIEAFQPQVAATDLSTVVKDIMQATDKIPLPEANIVVSRSEERRVGKECRSRWSQDDEYK